MPWYFGSSAPYKVSFLNFKNPPCTLPYFTKMSMNMNFSEIYLKFKSLTCIDSQTRELFNSKKVKIYIDKDVAQYIDCSDDEWKFLSGAPAGSDVSVDLFGRVVSILVTNDELLLNPLLIRLTFDKSNHPFIVFPWKLEVRAEHQGKGLGTRMMALTAHKAMVLGFQSMEVDAVQSVQSSTSMAHNGAYTAARLGFDGELSDSTVLRLPADL